MLNQNRIKGNKKRKNEGSIMFLVVIVMSALIVISSTAYYAAMSSRDRVVSQYQSEQSYQTALSANETITGYIDSYVAAVKKSGNPLADNALFSAILNLAVGETLTTTQNVSGMGTAETVITMLSHIDDSYTFDISTTATVDGAVSSVNCRKNLLLADTEVVNYLNRFFTSTGLSGMTETTLSGQDVDSPLYLENEMTKIVNGGDNLINNDVFSAGSVEDTAWSFNPEKEVNMYINKDFIVSGVGGSGLCLGGGTINVGGDFENQKGIGSSGKLVSVNVIGNYEQTGGQVLYIDKLNVGGTAYLTGTIDNCVIIVRGHLTIDSSSITNCIIYAGSGCTIKSFGNGNEIYIAGDASLTNFGNNNIIYVSGDSDLTNIGTGNEIHVAGDASLINFGNNNTMSVGGNITVNSTTSTSTFYVGGDYKCNVNSGQGNFYVNGDVILGFDWCNFEQVEHKGELVLNGYQLSSDQQSKLIRNPSLNISDKTDNISDNISIDTTVFDITKTQIEEKTAKQSYKDWEAEKYFNEELQPTRAIKPVIFLSDSTDPLATSEPVNKGDYWEVYGKIYITISENCTLLPADKRIGNNGGGIIFDTTAAGKDLYVLLQPNDGSDTFSWDNSGVTNILVRGPHSVIFILPDGVNFSSNAQDFVGHIEWAKLLANSSDDATVMGSLLAILAHEPSSNYSHIKSTIYVPEDTEMSLIDINSQLLNGNVDKVHNNIFFVKKDNQTITFNGNMSTFFGFIYAPYGKLTMTDNSGRFGVFGGIVVASYDFNTTSKFLFTTPYDYYSDVKENIVGTLIATASGGSYNPGGGGGSAMPDKIIDKYSTTAYY